MHIPGKWLMILFMLSACTMATDPVLPTSPSPTVSILEYPPLIASAQPSPSPMPSPRPFPRLTASPLEIEHWYPIQTALGQRLIPNLAPGEVLCEWEILGRAGQEIYVWAKCSSLEKFGQINPLPYAASMPAVIHMTDDGAVESVDIPGIGNQYASSIRALFPVDVQTIIFDDLIDYARLSQHLNWRLDHPDEPPLIVIESVPGT